MMSALANDSLIFSRRSGLRKTQSRIAIVTATRQIPKKTFLKELLAISTMLGCLGTYKFQRRTKKGQRIGVSAFCKGSPTSSRPPGLEFLKTGPGPLVYKERPISGAHLAAG